MAKKKPTKPAKKPAKRAPAKARTLVLVSTRKGAWIYEGDPARRSWKTKGPHFLGHIVNHMVLDPRDGRTLLAAAKTGHLGPTIFRSTDLGRSWKEAAKPPAFAKAPEGMRDRSVDHTFWLTPAHANEPNVWYAGTSPQGLFRSEDGGVTWQPFSSFHDDPGFRDWFGSEQDGTPDGPKLHSILIDPRDADHLSFAMSGGGVHKTRDKGKTWAPLVKGLEVVEGFDPKNIAFHDPHCVRMSPDPDRLWQQNHCGIYRLDRPSTEWVRVGKAMPKKVGDVGLPMTVHPRDPDTAWVFPMDGGGVWPRTSPDGIAGAFVTRNGGKTWKRLASGMPEGPVWWTVKRQAMAADKGDPVGVYFGTTSGELWGSRDEGGKWGTIARHLPEIYAVEAAEIR
jgi:photosystem II stability/assembly factor-like uncharacterized protein